MTEYCAQHKCYHVNEKLGCTECLLGKIDTLHAKVEELEAELKRKEDINLMKRLRTLEKRSDQAIKERDARIAELEKDKVESIDLGTDQFVTEKILELEALNKKLSECVVGLHEKISNVNDVLYGQNHGVINWHLNGDVEPLDNIFEENNHFTKEHAETIKLAKEISEGKD